jgi:hypothetical protein
MERLDQSETISLLNYQNIYDKLDVFTPFWQRRRFDLAKKNSFTGKFHGCSPNTAKKTFGSGRNRRSFTCPPT